MKKIFLLLLFISVSAHAKYEKELCNFFQKRTFEEYTTSFSSMNQNSQPAYQEISDAILKEQASKCENNKLGEFTRDVAGFCGDQCTKVIMNDGKKSKSELLKCQDMCKGYDKYSWVFLQGVSLQANRQSDCTGSVANDNRKPKEQMLNEDLIKINEAKAVSR